MRRIFWFAAVLSMAMGFLCGVPAWAQPVGMAAHVSGDVRLIKGGQSVTLKVLGRLQRGDKVVTGPTGRAVLVVFADGSRYELGGGKSAQIEARGVSGATRLPAFSGPSAQVAQLLGNARVGAAMSRQVGSLQRLQPDSPGYLTSTRPRFSWLAVPGAAIYSFTLFDSHDNVVWSVRTTETDASFAAELPELLVQRPYLWRLTAFGAGGKPLAQGRSGLITVLSAAEGAALAAHNQAMRGEAKATGQNTPLLLLAALYRDAGVPGAALEVLEEEALRAEPGVNQAWQQIVAELSPFTRALMRSEY